MVDLRNQRWLGSKRANLRGSFVHKGEHYTRVRLIGEDEDRVVLTSDLTERSNPEYIDPNLVDVLVTKRWIGESQDTVNVRLLSDGAEIDDAEISSANSWTHTFLQLPKDATYTIDIDSIDGYDSQVDGNVEEGFVVTSVRVGTVNVNGSKTWIGDTEGDRPESVSIELLANGVVVDEDSLTANDNWNYEFKDVSEFDEEGSRITYTVNELPVEGYETTIDGFNIINTIIPDEPEEESNFIVIAISNEDGEETDLGSREGLASNEDVSELGFDAAAINRVLDGAQNTHKGYTFELREVSE